MCALTRVGWNAPDNDSDLNTPSITQALANPMVRIGTSTPRLDPSGDDAALVFQRAGVPPAADGPQHAYGLPRNATMVMGGFRGAPARPARADAAAYFLTKAPESRKVDIVLTYCSTAVAARKTNSLLRVIALPPPLRVNADYAYVTLNGAKNRHGAERFGKFLTSRTAAKVLARYGFLPVTR